MLHFLYNNSYEHADGHLELKSNFRNKKANYCLFDKTKAFDANTN